MSRRVLDVRGTDARVDIGGNVVALSNLDKPFWPALGLTKRDLLEHYAGVAELLLPHLRDRAMVMKRYPNGWRGDHFFMKRTPEHAPEWIERCRIEHASGNVIDFPMVQDAATLLWVVNLGCIDLNPWYSRCDDVDRPDVLHFDLDPVDGTPFSRVREAALVVRDTLGALGMPVFVKTSGGSGMHVYVPIVRGPTQKNVWRFAKATAQLLAERHPRLLTAAYRIADRPRGRVLVDYNQNAWGRTLASIYSVRPNAYAGVSTPVEWAEVEAGVEPEDFTIRDVPDRLARTGDLWRPLVWPKRGRFDLDAVL
ncbi:MAG: non-homologous end-joining DNA ligase [Longimicrobiales bacterium]